MTINMLNCAQRRLMLPDICYEQQQDTQKALAGKGGNPSAILCIERVAELAPGG
jgi:hypothetical protein